MTKPTKANARLTMLSRIGPVGVRGTPRQLLIDVDKPMPTRLGRIRAVCLAAHVTPRLVEYIRTVHGWHIVVTVREIMTPWKIVALQAILGSDLTREKINASRVESLDRVPVFFRSRWNLLFEVMD